MLKGRVEQRLLEGRKIGRARKANELTLSGYSQIARSVYNSHICAKRHIYNYLRV